MLSRDEQELKIGRVDANRTLVLTSWGFLLGQLRTALEAEGSLTLIADLRQLEGLAARMETAGFVPFTLSDLTAPTPRHVVQLCNVVDAVVERLLQEPFADKKGLKATPARDGTDTTSTCTPTAASSRSTPMWARHGRSPLWLWVRAPGFKPSETADRALAARYGREECIEVHDGWGAGGTWLAIRVPEGRELDGVVSGITRQLADVAAFSPR